MFLSWITLYCIENEAGKMIKGNEAGEVVKGKSCYVSTLTQNMLFYAMTLETNRETPNICMSTYIALCSAKDW